MGQWNLFRPIFLPSLDRFRKAVFCCASQVPSVRILTDDQRQLNGRHAIKKLCTPRGCALRSRWQVARVPRSRITESHRQYGNLRRIVKGRLVNSHPFTQAVATRIVERNAGLMHFTSGGLSGNQNPSTGMNLQYRTWAQRQVFRAEFAAANFGNKFLCVLVSETPGLTHRLAYGHYGALARSPLQPAFYP